MSIKCKIYGDVLYCYDKEKKAVYAYPKQIKEFKKCPESVIEAFINEKYDAEIIFGEATNGHN
jgi:hypothetical protein